MKIFTLKKAFTFVEILIASSILVIIATLGFYSYSKYSNYSRNTERISDINNISSTLKLYKQKRGYLPLPGDFFIIKNGSREIAYQGKLNEKVALTNLNQIPLDPLLHIPYLYSITKNKQEFQIGATLENNGNPQALLEGNYQTISKNILPSIMIAHNGSGSVDISQSTYKNKFIINKTAYNIPYSLETGIPISNSGASFSEIISNPNNFLVQNTSFKSCEEICETKKSIGDGQYQILSASGSLKNIFCYFKVDSCEVLPLDCEDEVPTNATLSIGEPEAPDTSWQNINSSNPCYFICNVGHSFIDESCTPNNCDASNQIIEPYSHSYSVPAFNHGTNTTQTFVVSITNGTRTYSQTFACNAGVVSENGGEVNTANTCSGYYTWNGSDCVDLRCIFGAGVFGTCIF